MKAILLLAALLTFSATMPSAQARAPRPQSWIYGYGTKSCGQWTADKIDADRAHRDNTNMPWVAGFISAVNVTGGHQLIKTDFDAMAQWMDNYCVANPLKIVADAAVVLAQALAVH